MTATAFGAVNAAAALFPTPVKTSAYTAVPGDFVIANISSGGFTVKLPDAPANGSRCGAKIIATDTGSTNLLTIATQGSDVFNKAGGTTSMTLNLSGQGIEVLYAAGIWYVTGDDLPLPAVRDLVPDWLNAFAFGAAGNGTSDDTAALNALLAAAAETGAAAYLPATDAAGSPAVYSISSSLTFPSGVTLLGSHGRLVNGTIGGPVIKPSSSFTGNAVIEIQPGQEYELGGFTVDCSNLPTTASINGIACTGSNFNGYVHDLLILNAPATGYTSGGTGNTWRFRRVTVFGTTSGPGFNLGEQTDDTLIDCHTLATGGQGYFLSDNSNTTLIGCRAEFAGGSFGFQIAGSLGQGVRMVGCSTDRSDQDGLHISSTGTDPIVISGCVFRRDGKSSTTAGWAGIAIASGVTNPVVIDGCAVFTDVEDDGTGNPAPQFGMTVNLDAGAAPSRVIVTGTYLNGVDGPSSGVTSANGCQTRNVTGQTGFPAAGPFTPVDADMTVLTGSAVTVTGVTTATSVLAGPVIPAGQIMPGLVYEFAMWGTITTTADTQTFSPALFVGGVAGTNVTPSGAINPDSSAAVTAASWRFSGQLTFRSATSASAAWQTDANFFPSVVNQAETTVSTTAAQALTLGITPSATAVSVTVQGGYIRRAGS